MKLLCTLFFLSMMNQDSSIAIYDFKANNNTLGWYVVNDGVMGGLSQGQITINDAGNGVFEGYVTTENNGGFSAVRYAFNIKDVSKFEHVILKVKGDGKAYQFRIKENSTQRFSYTATFKTSGVWENIKIPLKSFYPTYRGSRLDKPNYAGEKMEEITIFIGNKKKESFSLEIENILLK